MFPCVIKFMSFCPLPSKSTNRFFLSCFGLFLLVNSVWSVHIFSADSDKMTFSLKQPILWTEDLSFSWKQWLEMKNIVHHAAFHKTLLDWSGVDYCNVFISCLDSFWRHPFTTDEPLVSKWCNATLLQIWWRNKLINILVDLSASKVSAYRISGWTISKMHAHEEDGSVQKWLALTSACSPALAQSNLYWAGARPSAESTAPASLT